MALCHSYLNARELGKAIWPKEVNSGRTAGSMQPSQEPGKHTHTHRENGCRTLLRSYSHTLKCSCFSQMCAATESYKEKFLYNFFNAPSWTYTLELSNIRATLTCSPWSVTLYLLQSDALADDHMLLASCIHCLHRSFHLFISLLPLQ